MASVRGLLLYRHLNLFIITQRIQQSKTKQLTPKHYKLHKMHTAPGFLMVIRQLVSL